MDLATRRIPPSEWDLWKTTILDLAADNTIKKVISIMEDDHGFTASHSQYETQLDLWENRKNLERNEWVKILDILDTLKQRHEECRLLISGHPVPTSRIQRARRYRKSEVGASKRQKKKKGRSANFRNVSIEILRSDGRWTIYENLDDASLTDHFKKRPPGDLFGNTGPAADSVGIINRQLDVQVDLLGMNNTPLHPNISHVSDAQVPGPHIIGDGVRITLSFPVPSFAQDMLRDLPFERFKRSLEAQGVCLTSLSLDSSGVSGVQQVTLTAQNPIKLSAGDFFCLSDAMSPLSPLRNLLSNQGFQGVSHHMLDPITDDDVIPTKFNQILLFSIANGFAGLHDVPIERVFKHLSRYANLTSLLLRLLQTNRSHVAKALTENLFRAAVEAGSEAVLKVLLTVCSIDVDTTLCIVDGKKYTPLERAATLQHLGVVRLLLKTGADVNKTFASQPSDGGPLAYLISAMLQNADHAPISDSFELGNLLLQAGAEVHIDNVLRSFQTLQHYHCVELSYALVAKVSDIHHRELIGCGILYKLADQFDDWQATDATKKIIMACDRTSCGCCFTTYEKEVEWAGVKSAKRGHLQLVQLLLPYCKFRHRVLSAAIRCGKVEVIDAILALGVDIDAPAHDLDKRMEESIPSGWDSETLTTSLAEAIEAEDNKLVLMIEGAGFLDHLREGGRFRTAIAAASKIGNINYVRKLLCCCNSPEPSHMREAVLFAVQNDHEEIFWLLLAAGADVNSDLIHSIPGPLLAAMLSRNHRMVRGILNADVYMGSMLNIYAPLKRGRISVFGEAVKWGNISVLQDLRFSFPGVLLQGFELSEALEQGNAVWFEFLLDSGIASESALTHCLEFGLSRGDADLVHNLVKRGADPTDHHLLTTCTLDYPERLPLLLDHIRSQSSSCTVRGFGTKALNAAIRSGRKGFEAVRILLDSGLIDAKSFVHNMHELPSETPLGVAINFSSKSYPADFTVIEKLFDAGCDPNSVVMLSRNEAPYFVQTALLEAIQTTNKDLVQLLISRGADFRAEATLTVKRTPIQKAVEVESLEIVTLLLELGADVNSKPATRSGATALQMAAIRGDCIIAAKLFDYGADLNMPPSQINGRWPLEGAAEYGRLEMIEFLWKMNCGSFPKEQCRKAIELAEENGHTGCRDLIAELSLAGISSLPERSFSQWSSFEMGLDLM